jgi:hypothetical protein
VPISSQLSEAYLACLGELRRGAVFQAALHDYSVRSINPARSPDGRPSAAESAALKLILEEEEMTEMEAGALMGQAIWLETLRVGFEDAKSKYFEFKGKDRSCK